MQGHTVLWSKVTKVIACAVWRPYATCTCRKKCPRILDLGRTPNQLPFRFVPKPLPPKQSLNTQRVYSRSSIERVAGTRKESASAPLQNFHNTNRGRQFAARAQADRAAMHSYIAQRRKTAQNKHPHASHAQRLANPRFLRTN